MTKKEKEEEKNLRMIKYNLERRLDCVNAAASMTSNGDIDAFREILLEVEHYVFKGLLKSDQEQKPEEDKSEE
tara:strand:+ start:746 stop:964 length:219 start_codon:yes stop_codon:yes gene_type:complete